MRATRRGTRMAGRRGRRCPEDDSEVEGDGTGSRLVEAGTAVELDGMTVGDDVDRPTMDGDAAEREIAALDGSVPSGPAPVWRDAVGVASSSVDVVEVEVEVAGSTEDWTGSADGLDSGTNSLVVGSAVVG